MIESWRIVKTRRSKEIITIQGKKVPEAFSGTAASLYPGRWNSKNTEIVYTASSQALAVLEILVHVNDAQFIENYSVFRVMFNKSDVLVLEDYCGLPDGWDEQPADIPSRKVGDQWIDSGDSLVLAVPSVIVPEEKNYLINPAHPSFKMLEIDSPRAFPFDKRLIG